MSPTMMLRKRHWVSMDILRPRRPTQHQSLMPVQAGFIILKPNMASIRLSTRVNPRAQMRTLLATVYPSRLKAIIKDGGYKPQQSFNVDERGLMWKKMPEHKYTAKEKFEPGFKAFKDRFTLLLGANLTGYCKLKPVMVYLSENPRALKGYDKSSLAVHWNSNATGWMTGSIFQAYGKGAFVAELKEYCMANDLPFHILMVLDNAPAHPHIARLT